MHNKNILLIFVEEIKTKIMRKLLSALLKTSIPFIALAVFLGILYLFICFVKMEWLEFPVMRVTIMELFRTLLGVYLLGVVLFYFTDKKE